MRVGTLTQVVKLASKFSNSSSLTPLYRSVELRDVSIRCCSEFGNIEIFEPTGLKDSCLLDCESLTSIVASLPQDSEFVMDQKSHRLEWACGDAKGHLNYVQTDATTTKINHPSFPWKPEFAFGDALLLAKSACQMAAVSIGLYGISIEPNGSKLHLLSSNSISLAMSTVDKGAFPAGKIVVRPPVPEIIAYLMRFFAKDIETVDTEGKKKRERIQSLEFDIVADGGKNDGIYILGDQLVAVLPLGRELDHDLKKMAEQFPLTKEVAKINTYEVRKFISRARNLAEKNSDFKIAVKIENGKLVLSHEAIASSTEQWMIAEGMDATQSYDLVSLDGDLLMLPLEFVTVADFGYLKDKQIVLRGENPEFMYVVGGRD